MEDGEAMGEETSADVVLSFRRRKNGDKNQYLVNFEDAVAAVMDADVVEQRRWSYNVVRLVDILRGEQNVSSLSTAMQARLNRLGDLLHVQDRPYRLPSIVRRQVDDYETVLLFCGQVYELRSLDSIDWRDAQTVVYTGDTWEPQLNRLASLVDQYDVDTVLCSYRAARDFLSDSHDAVYWLPQAIDPAMWRDYGLDKEYTCIQFGRKNPTLDEFAREQFADDEYVDWYIPGFENLARHINRSKFCLAAPRLLQSPEETGDISPVTVRYYQAMACKSMPAGFKPREFDDIFPEDVFFLEYQDDEQFADAIDFYKRNEGEYWEKVELNYELVMKNHTWHSRAQEMAATL